VASDWAEAKAREWLLWLAQNKVTLYYNPSIDPTDSLAALLDSVREEANKVWQDSLGYATPEETWRKVNRKRGEQRADTLAEVRRIVEEIRDRWASGQSGGERIGTCDEILKQLEGLK
jgi:hypothetical protein